jgi:glycosyltransferase involved in cell wall biosynthesis
MPQGRQMPTVKVKFILPDLINIYGSTKEVDYNWAMDRIRKGHAILADTATKTFPQQQQPKPLTPAKPAAPIKSKKSYDIVWVEDNNILGGAELSGRCVVNVGTTLGYDIYKLTPQNFDIPTLRRAKLIILNNIWSFTNNQMAELRRTIFEFQVPHVKYEHDMREVDYDKRLPFSRQLFKHSKCNFFISPLHLKYYQDRLPEMSSCHVLPLALDVDNFAHNPQIKRQKNKVVHTSGNIHNKGLQSILELVVKRRDLQFDIYAGNNGSNTVQQLFANESNVRLCPKVEHDKMADIYSAAEYLVHLPHGKWAGERVVLEAALCGCKLITNDNIGHLSWGWDLSDVAGLKEKLKPAPYEFWKVIEGVM